TTGAFDQAVDLSKLATGSHTLVLTATDAAGNAATDTLHVSLPVLPMITLTEVTPMAGEQDVGVTFPPEGRFSRAVDLGTLNSNSFYATDTTGALLAATVVPWSDATGAWLFFSGPMPSASTVTLHVLGEDIKGLDGTLLDAAGTGTAGSDF